MSIRMNKGEHSESLFALHLLMNGHVLQFSDFLIKYDPETFTLSLHDLDDIFINSFTMNISEIFPTAIIDVKNGSGSFSFNILNPYYRFLTNNGIKVKAPSKYKSDLIIAYHVDPNVEICNAGVSVKSFLGSNPSILNASKHWSALEYVLAPVSDKTLKNGMLFKDLPESVLNTMRFDKYSNTSFETLVGDFTVLPQLVLSWKIGNGSKIINLFDHIENLSASEYKKYVKQADKFIGRIIQGDNENDKPSLLGTVNKDGSMVLSGLDSLGSVAYFDAPSRSRHDYGYVYEENGFWRMRIVIGIRGVAN